MMLSQEELPEVFSDVAPVPQDDGPNPVCAIDYSPQFIQAYDYMRAILKTAEKSERALRLTGLCLKLNPANYTIWHFRRQCLEEMIDDDNRSKIVTRDLQLAATLGGANPKNYQIWYHRRALLEEISAGSGKHHQQMGAGISSSISSYVPEELDYVATVLEEDSKNYHAWSHRQWIVRTVNEASLWEKELQFAHSLIQQDPRNNSAWNQRWFVCHEGGSIKRLSLDTAKKEADYAISGASLDPYNESPWRYLIGILKEQCNNHVGGGAAAVAADEHTQKALLDEYEEKICSGQPQEVIKNAGKDPDACASLVSARIDILHFKGDAASLEKAIELASGLASEHDPIRKKYWLLRVEETKRLLK